MKWIISFDTFPFFYESTRIFFYLEHIAKLYHEILNWFDQTWDKKKELSIYAGDVWGRLSAVH